MSIDYDRILMDLKRGGGMRKLSDFLKEARESSSYESLINLGEKRLDDGTRITGPYSNGGFVYVDRYKGGETFDGVEEISLKGKAVWTRHYDGGIIEVMHLSKREMGEVYKFLKTALRNFPKEEPFKRGPDIFVQGDFTYTDACKGDIVSFRGSEIIHHKGRSVFAVSYGGGLIRI